MSHSCGRIPNNRHHIEKSQRCIFSHQQNDRLLTFLIIKTALIVHDECTGEAVSVVCPVVVAVVAVVAVVVSPHGNNSMVASLNVVSPDFFTVKLSMNLTLVFVSSIL